MTADMKRGQTHDSIYARSLFPQAREYALFDPCLVPLRLRVGDVGWVDSGRWRRLYNALDKDNRYNLPALELTEVQGPYVYGRNFYASRAFQLQR
jgi:hypothetical protein